MIKGACLLQMLLFPLPLSMLPVFDERASERSISVWVLMLVLGV